MAMPSPSKLALSGLLYPLHFLEGFARAEFGYLQGRAARLWAAIIGVPAAGATALFLLRTIGLRPGPIIVLSAYGAGVVVAIFFRVIFAGLFPNSEDER